MKAPHWIIIAVAGFGLAACDVVKFPGSGPRRGEASPPEISEPPRPPGEETPIASSPDAPTPTNPAEPLLDPILPPSNPADDPANFASITDLLTINATRCAPTSAGASLTLAEVAGARPAAANITAQAVNGTQTTSAAFPGIVKMEPRRTLANGGISSGHCGATRIAQNWFITASHCLDDTYDEIELIATQSTLTDPRAIRVQASASLCHAAYGGSGGQYANDVALVAISDEAAAALSAVPIAKFGQTEKTLGPANYASARMAGWGLTSFEDATLSDMLLTTELTLISSGPAAITVSSREGAGPCIGDSGGPLLVDEANGALKLVGVLSVVEQNRLTGAFCEGTYNARYTNLQGYTDWIENVIGVCAQTPGLCAR